MEKRNVIISGEFSLTEVKNVVNKSAKPKTAAARIAALKAAGIDTSNYFPMGEEMVVKVVDGVPVQVMDDDPIYNKIAGGGYIGHYKLFRRWVMAQTFSILRTMEQTRLSCNEILQSRGYEYQWRVLEEELYAQAKMLKHGDTECLTQRSRWFNGAVAGDMVRHYICSLKDYIESNLMYRRKSDGEKTFKHRCKGTPYVRLGNRNVFVEDLESKVYSPLVEIGYQLNHANAQKAYELVHKFNKERKHLLWNTKMSPRFVNAYKGSGAYFTMRNLIMFHGARFMGMTESKSLTHVEGKAKAYASSDEGWRMTGVMKQLISDSNISIQGKINEWRK